MQPATRPPATSSSRLLGQRVEDAEAARALRDRAARADERTAIAREMHDVLAHKVSLISLYAGALEVQSEHDPHLAHAAATLRRTAHEALEELRVVLGVLRQSALDDDTFTDLDRLVTSWTATGSQITVDDRADLLPEHVARTAFRIVQEGLTNAARHAPGAPVRVTTATIEGAATVEVVNAPTARAAEPTHMGAGLGLTGLAERCELAGGRLEVGPTSEGGWRLAAWLPLAARASEPADSSSRVTT